MKIAIRMLFLVVFIMCVTRIYGNDEQQMPQNTQFNALSESVRTAYAAHIAASGELRKTEAELRKQINRSEQSERDKLLRYIADLASLSFGGELNDDRTEDPWAAGIVVVSTPRDIVLEAIVPELEAGGRMRSILTRGDQDLRKYLEQESETAPPSIDQYLQYLGKHGFDESAGLVEYLLQAYPERGFVGLVTVQGDTLKDRSTLLSCHHEIWAGIASLEKEVDVRTTAALERLSKHGEWWVRLYVAEIMQQHPKLRTDAPINRLREDPHELVREVMARKNTPGPQ